jgi:hypothetical protein
LWGNIKSKELFFFKLKKYLGPKLIEIVLDKPLTNILPYMNPIIMRNGKIDIRKKRKKVN